MDIKPRQDDQVFRVDISVCGLEGQPEAFLEVGKKLPDLGNLFS